RASVKDRRTAYERKQRGKARGARRVPTGQPGFNLPVFQSERARELLNCFVVQTNRREYAGQFVIEGRESPILASEAQSPFCFQWFLVRYQSARQRNLCPRVTWLNRHGLLRQVKPAPGVVVRHKPVGRSHQQRQIPRLLFVLQRAV